MKNLFILSVITILLTACSKTDTNNHFSFNLDGKNFDFNPEISYAQKSQITASKYYITLFGKESETSTAPKITLYLTYYVDSLNVPMQLTSWMDVEMSNFDGYDYYGVTEKPNQYIIKEISFENESIVGSFEFYVESNSLPTTKQVKNGSFKLPLYDISAN